MAIYTGQALLTATRERKHLNKFLKRHLAIKQVHDTVFCDYCRSVAEDIGLLLARR